MLTFETVDHIKVAYFDPAKPPRNGQEWQRCRQGWAHPECLRPVDDLHDPDNPWRLLYQDHHRQRKATT